MAVRKKKTASPKKRTSAPKKKSTENITNRNAQWKAYRELQMQADRAWEKFRDDVKKCAKSDILVRDNNQLLLLLAECNYMARECMRIANKGKKKGR